MNTKIIIRQLFHSAKYHDCLEHCHNFLKTNKNDSYVLQISYLCYLNIGKYEKAKIQILKFLKLKPKDVDAYFNLSIIEYSKGNKQNALRYLKKTIFLNPNLVDAQINIANIYGELGHFEKAEEAYNKIFKTTPQSTKAHNNFSVLLGKLNRDSEAVDHAKIAAQLNPEDPTFHFNLCDLLEKTNRLDELQLAVKNALENCPASDPGINFQLGKMQFRNKNYETAVETFRKQSMLKFGPSMEATRLSFLAKSEDKIGKYNDAFQNFITANNILKNLDTSLEQRRIDYCNSISNFSKLLDQATPIKFEYHPEKNNHSNSNDEINPVFMVGFPRSGTTLLDTMLRAHPSIDVAEEKQSVIKAIEACNTSVEDVVAMKVPKQTIRKMRKAYIKELSKHVDISSDIVVDKLPLNFLNIAYINAIFPNAKFIFSVRHPYDCVLSCFMQSFELNQAMANFTDIEKSSRFYDLTMNFWAKALAYFDINCRYVYYETLVQNPDETILSCLKFLGLEWHENITNYRNIAKEGRRIRTPSYNQVTQDFYFTSIGRWKNYQPEFNDISHTLDKWCNYWNYKI